MECSAPRLPVRTPVAPATAQAARSPCSVFRLWPPASGLSPSRLPARAFTLLELLIVMSLIAVLASITLVIGRSVTERSKVAQAKAEMAVLAAALEQYKQHYGDYPWTPDEHPPGYSGAIWDGGVVLFNALNGNLGPKGNKLAQKGRVFIELGRFVLASHDENDLPNHPSAADPTELKMNWFNDPWGGWYWYHYKREEADNVAAPAAGRWRSKGFLLYSHGPDSECRPGNETVTGLLEDRPTEPDKVQFNRDNIYYGRD